jgi:hypothetical protein
MITRHDSNVPVVGTTDLGLMMVQNLHKLREEIALGMDRGHCFRSMFAECRTRKSFKKLSIEARIGKYGIDFVVVTQRTEWSL